MTAKSFAELFARAEKTLAYQADAVALDFCDAVRRMLELRQISRAELARRLDVSPAYVSKMLSGDENLTIETMVKVAMALDGTVALDVRPKEEQRKADVVFGLLTPRAIRFDVRTFEHSRFACANSDFEPEAELAAA
jgi:transcriptional regulator with XRE-family HTH domain